VEGKRLNWDWKEALVGQVVTPFDPMEEPEAIVEIGNDNEERDIDQATWPDIEPAIGQNLEDGLDSEDNRDQDSDQGSIAEQDQEFGGPTEPKWERLIDPEPEEDLAIPPPEAPRAAGLRSSRHQRVPIKLYPEKDYVLCITMGTIEGKRCR
jgi:hypothetical protein